MKDILFWSAWKSTQAIQVYSVLQTKCSAAANGTATSKWTFIDLKLDFFFFISEMEQVHWGPSNSLTDFLRT